MIRFAYMIKKIFIVGKDSQFRNIYFNCMVAGDAAPLGELYI